MAWCESCAEVVKDDETLHDEEGVQHCPTCHSVVVQGPEEEAPPKPPWHFKLLVVATVIYLIYRLIWFIFWLQHHA
jgi:hypothetical protein